ncbi:hypothetical protein L211DRAFT_348581 [Terfezia boudieri ATCC MYA-4762]|uniref:Uncharacterized protein n=1 Tax=Terfezia boudieri ATCC MYA-4762 TaxID=1051890 RepID=A0A3N4LKT8_9PEZI|nr:hypothetical protein L211DRAFT_348581 [Terfezia boudieri ATCC MYA-4762]
MQRRLMGYPSGIFTWGLRPSCGSPESTGAFERTQYSSSRSLYLLGKLIVAYRPLLPSYTVLGSPCLISKVLIEYLPFTTAMVHEKSPPKRKGMVHNVVSRGTCINCNPLMNSGISGRGETLRSASGTRCGSLRKASTLSSSAITMYLSQPSLPSLV